MSEHEPFDPEALLRKIDKLHEQGKAEQLRNLMLQPWPRMQEDIRRVADHLVFEARRNGSVPMFLKSYKVEGDTVTFEMPDWFNAALKDFQETYRRAEADLRFRKAVTTLQDSFFRAFEGSHSAALDSLERVIEESFAANARYWGTA